MKVESKNPLQRKGVECQVCAHPDRASVELGIANKVPARVLAKRYGLHDDAVARHGKRHMTPELHAHLMTRGRMQPTDLENLRITESEGVLQHLVALRGRMYGWADIAEQQGDVKAAAAIAAQIVKNIEVTAKLLGDIKTGTTNITNNLLLVPEYHALRTAMMQALRPYPEALAAVALVLRDVQTAALPAAETPEERAEAEPVLAKAREASRKAREVRAGRVIEGTAKRVPRQRTGEA